MLQRQFVDKEHQLQDQQVAMATKLGEAEHEAATLRSALVRTRASCKFHIDLVQNYK